VATEAAPRPAWVRAFLLAGMLVTCTALFIWLLEETAERDTDAFDRAVLAWVTASRRPQLTTIATDLTALGSRTLLAIATLMVVALLWTGGRKLAALDTVVACTAAGAITRLVKILLARSRPPIETQLITTTGFSFPSGHVSGVTALLAATALHTIEAARSRAQRWILGLCYAVLILGVGWSRVYLGVHYPSDVAAGLCLGIGCSLASHGLLRTPRILRSVRTLLRRAA